MRPEGRDFLLAALRSARGRLPKLSPQGVSNLCSAVAQLGPKDRPEAGPLGQLRPRRVMA